MGPAGAAAAVLLAATCIFVPGTTGMIVHLDSSDPANCYYHQHAEILIPKKTGASISFEVECVDSQDGFVSWMVVPSSPDGISTFLAGCKATSDDESCFISARCNTALRRERADGDGDGEQLNTTTPTAPAPTSTSANVTCPAVAMDVQGAPGAPYCDQCSFLAFDAKYVMAPVKSGQFECNETSTGANIVQIRDLERTGFYTLWVQSGKQRRPEAGQELKGPCLRGNSTFQSVHGYLSADLYPLMVFYGLMGLVYMFTGFAWLGLMACYYHDLLRLQFWIGAVVGLGMLEMAISYGDLEYLNKYGTRSNFLLVFSKILFAGKNTLARLLVLIVCMGYGVVKPRLGAAVKQIAALGCSYFFFAAAYGVFHNMEQTETQESKTELMVIIPLSVIDAAICWWIFLSLHHTMKILTLRNNVVKLQLFGRFKWALIFAILITCVFGIWFLYQHFGRSEDEIDWQDAWWEDGYIHLLFYGIMVVIMFLWRPSSNNSRYAYAALETDIMDDNEFSGSAVVPTFNLENMKSRTLSSRGKEPQAAREEVEDDLKWVEENIPSSVISNDNTFPNFPMDSDEEIMNTRFELSKMD